MGLQPFDPIEVANHLMRAKMCVIESKQFGFTDQLEEQLSAHIMHLDPAARAALRAFRRLPLSDAKRLFSEEYVKIVSYPQDALSGPQSA